MAYFAQKLPTELPFISRILYALPCFPEDCFYTNDPQDRSKYILIKALKKNWHFQFGRSVGKLRPKLPTEQLNHMLNFRTLPWLTEYYLSTNDSPKRFNCVPIEAPKKNSHSQFDRSVGKLRPNLVTEWVTARSFRAYRTNFRLLCFPALLNDDGSFSKVLGAIWSVF